MGTWQRLSAQQGGNERSIPGGGGGVEGFKKQKCHCGWKLSS